MTDRHDPTDNPAFTSAICGATLPGMAATWEHPGFVLWTFAGCETGFYATPCWEGVDGIAISVEREGATYTDTLPCEWTGDGCEDAHRYLAAMRRWQRTLPTLYARWEGDPSTDFVGSLLDLCAEYDGSNIWDRACWWRNGNTEPVALLDLLDRWSARPTLRFATYLDNMVIRTSPFPVETCETCGQ